MDDDLVIKYIRSQIDKSFKAADEITNHNFSSQYEVQYEAHSSAFIYCGGYIQACINFRHISRKTYYELIKYCEDKRGGK